MEYQNETVKQAAEKLAAMFEELADKSEILRAPEFTSLFEELKRLPPEQKPEFGKEVNQLKQDLQQKVAVANNEAVASAMPPIDVTAPFDVNVPPKNRPQLLPAETGSVHPLMSELEKVVEIFARMGFDAEESREIDDDWHMFTSLNFPENHPARDDYDTFMAEQQDSSGKPLIAPAHTSTMQNRVMKKYAENLQNGEPIAAVIPGRVFRNEDVDARHDHTFYQIEGVFVGEKITAGNLIATLKTFLQTYYGKELDVKTQPFYFPFTEPSFEFALSCPFCDKKGCQVCSRTGWIELIGCGLIHPNVLKMASIDSQKYTGFAWGFGLERLVMMKYNIEDIRHFQSANLNFLRQFV
jgi:phenylalanyl-tRNA synthetase alpha chain